MTKISFISIITFIIIITILSIILYIIHPIYLIILLILYSIITCFLISLWRSNFIYSIILFLIIIRGILIIFLYFSSLISNEQNKITWRSFLLINLILNFILLIFLYSNHYFYIYPYYPSLNLIPLNYSNLIPQFSNIIKIFIYPNNYITFISIFYLLIALFTIIKICSLKSSSLRKIN